MPRLILLALLLSGCVAPPPADTAAWPAAPVTEEAARNRAAELECIRRGEIAERQQPWLGANNPRAAVIGARVRNSCLESFRRGEGLGGTSVPYY